MTSKPVVSSLVEFGFENTSTIGDVDQASHGTRVEVTTKTETVDVYADNKLHYMVVCFSLKWNLPWSGMTFPDGSFQSSAHMNLSHLSTEPLGRLRV